MKKKKSGAHVKIKIKGSAGAVKRALKDLAGKRDKGFGSV